AGNCAGKAERVAGLACRTGAELGIRELERFNRISHRAVVYRPIEVRRHAEYSVPQYSRELLVNIIAAAVELTHRIAVDHVDVAIFSRAHGEVPDRPRAIIEVRQHQCSTGTEIGIGVILRLL